VCLFPSQGITCTAAFSVTVVTTTGNVAIPSTVSVRWDMNTIITSSSSTGVYSFSYKVLSTATSCTFAVTSVTATGYDLSALPAAMRLTF
jgi:hypothetical protein